MYSSSDAAQKFAKWAMIVSIAIVFIPLLYSATSPFFLGKIGLWFVLIVLLKSLFSLRSLLTLIVIGAYVFQRYAVSLIASTLCIVWFVISIPTLFMLSKPLVGTMEEMRSSPPPGSLAPGPSTIPAELAHGQTQIAYGQYAYEVYYTAEKPAKPDGEPEQIRVAEDFEQAYRPIEIMSGDTRKHFQTFQFEGYPGYIAQTRDSTFRMTDNYDLTWDDAGTPLQIYLSNAPIGKYNPTDIIGLLQTMIRVPGDSPKKNLAQPPVGIMVPSTLSIPPGFTEQWRQFSRTRYTLQYASVDALLTFKNNTEGSYARYGQGQEATSDDVPPDVNLMTFKLLSTVPFAANGSTGVIRTYQPPKSYKTLYHVSWNDHGNLLEIVLANVPPVASPETYFGNLIGTMIPQPGPAK